MSEIFSEFVSDWISEFAKRVSTRSNSQRIPERNRDSKGVVCSYWTIETKDDSSFSVIGSSLGGFAGKLNSFQLSCFASEFVYTRKEQKKFQSLTSSLKISLKWKPAFSRQDSWGFLRSVFLYDLFSHFSAPRNDTAIRK